MVHLADLYVWRNRDSFVNFRRSAHNCRDRIPAITRRGRCRYSSTPQHVNAVGSQRDHDQRGGVGCRFNIRLCAANEHYAANDHQTAHDLVGCQDIAWDLAGAAVEMDMSETQRNALILALGQRVGRQIESDFVAAMELCYLGFQIGLWTMAQGRNNQAVGDRIEKLLARYGRHRTLRSLGINL